MSHAVIPAPVRFEVGGGREFMFRPGTAVGYADPGLAPIARRFCSEITRRTGLRLAPRAGHPVPGEPSVKIELAAGDDIRALPAPTGLSPAGDGPADERYSLVIDGDQVVVRAMEPIGVARGLTTLIQLLAATPSASAGGICLPPAHPRRAEIRLARSVARPGPQVLHRRGDPAGDRPARAVQAQRAAPAPDRRPKLAAPGGPAGRETGARRRLLQRPGPPCAGRLRRGPLRHGRSRGRHARGTRPR